MFFPGPALEAFTSLTPNTTLFIFAKHLLSLQMRGLDNGRIKEVHRALVSTDIHRQGDMVSYIGIIFHARKKSRT